MRTIAALMLALAAQQVPELAILERPLRAQAAVPEPIKARVNQLVAQCAQAGGTLGNMTGQGQFVIPKDFTADGRSDFVISEGNFPCTGKPNLFRPDGLAKVELWVADGKGSAMLVFQDRLIAYRILAGPPARLQIARKGEACGPGSGAASRCGDELRWNMGGRRFDQIATDGRDTTPRPASASLAADNMSAVPAGPAPALLALLPDAEARHIAKCRKETLAGNPQAAKWVDGECTESWKRARSTGAAADAFLAVLPAAGSAPAALATAKSRMSAVRWAAPARAGEPTVGALGELKIQLQGAGAPSRVYASWNRTGALIPFDMPGAFEARGARLTLVACEKLGVGEGTRTWAGTASGRQPFTLTVDSREAPTADATSSYGVAMNLTGKTASRGDLSSCREF